MNALIAILLAIPLAASAATDADRARLEQGRKQVAAAWRAEDGSAADRERFVQEEIEEHMRTHGPLGKEFERMARFGSVTPDLWMKNATGEPVSPRALLRTTEAALQQIRD